jgi:group I intron endonuclease
MIRICAIYMIKNLITKKVYIGQSTNIVYRFYYHYGKLKKGVHPNTHLQASWNKYGEDNFEFSVIDECKKDQLNEREIFWIEVFNSFFHGYNQTLGGIQYNISKKKRLEWYKPLWDRVKARNEIQQDT